MTYFYYYVSVFLFFRVFCSVYSAFIVPTGTLRLPWLRFLRAFFSVVRQILAKTGHGPHSSQLGHNFYPVSLTLVLVWPLWVRIPESLPIKVANGVILCIVRCKCVLYYCHGVSTQLQLTNIKISINMGDYTLYIIHSALLIYVVAAVT